MTVEEYDEKVAKIETEKAQEEVKNSKEYKQLKSLFESGILTKEEFENKVAFIQLISDKKINTKEIENVIKSVNQTYLTEIKEDEPTKKVTSKSTYILLTFLYITIVTIIYLLKE